MSSMRHVEILRAACCVAGQDGTITDQESAMLNKLTDQIGVGQMSLNAMIERAKQDPQFYREQFEVLRADAVLSPALRLLPRKRPPGDGRAGWHAGCLWRDGWAFGDCRDARLQRPHAHPFPAAAAFG